MKVFFKFCAAIIVGFVLLNVFCFYYYNLPIHISAKDGATDYVWQPNFTCRKATEGFAVTRTNNEGRFNSFDYDEGLEIENLVMGSSHMEATNVNQDESVSYLLNKRVGRTYNLGTSGHNLLVVARNVENALHKYRPEKYLIIETGSISFNERSLLNFMDDPRIPSYDSGIVFQLQKIPYLRLIYSQVKHMMSSGDEGEHQSISASSKGGDYIKSMGAVLKHISDSARKTNNNLKVIIFYHPHMHIVKGGVIEPVKNDVKMLGIFKELCKDNGILFINIEKYFVQNYKKNFVLPHGFANTTIGTGHLNKYGHKVIADVLTETIASGE